MHCLIYVVPRQMVVRSNYTMHITLIIMLSKKIKHTTVSKRNQLQIIENIIVYIILYIYYIIIYIVTETWLSAQGDEAKTAELAPSGFDVKSFPRQSQSRGGGIATVYKSTLGSNITFKTNFDFTHTSFEVVQASITLQHNTLHFFCLYRPPPNRRNNLTDSMFTEQLFDLDYVNRLPGFVCLVGDMNIHFDNPLQSLTKQTLSTLSLYSLVQVINKPTHRCGHIIDWVIVRPDDDIHRKSTVTDSLESDHYCTKSYFNISVSKPSTLYRTVRNIANIDRPSFIAELSSVSEFTSVENANQFCDFCALY